MTHAWPLPKVRTHSSRVRAAKRAAKRLARAGFEKVFVLDGGIGAWQQAGLPLVKGR